MDRLISEQAVIDRLSHWYSDMLETNKEQEDLIEVIKAIPSAEQEDSEDKIIRRTLENFMRGLWEEIQVGELEYTTSEIYEMLEREIFTDNHVAVSSKNTEPQGDDRWLIHFGQNMAIPSADPYKGMTNGQVHDMLYQMLVELKDGADRYGAEYWWNSPYKGEQE